MAATFRSSRKFIGPAASLRSLIHQYSIDPVGPGSPFNLLGGFGVNANVVLTRSDGTAVQNEPVSASGQVSRFKGARQHEIPFNWALDLYQVHTVEGSVTSAPIWLNRAVGAFWHHNEVAPGNVLRLVGRCLYFGAGQTVVTLVPKNTALYGSTVLTATVLNSHPAWGDSRENRLLVQFPTNMQVGVEYVVYVWNGLGSPANGRAAVMDNVTCIAPGVDSFNIGRAIVPYAGNFDFGNKLLNVVTGQVGTLANGVATFSGPNVLGATPLATGNGISNDARAIAAALIYLSANGGGVAWLPKNASGPSYYRLLTNEVQAKNRTGIVCEEKNGTRSYLGGQGNSPSAGFMVNINIPNNTKTFIIANADYSNTNTATDNLPAANISCGTGCEEILIYNSNLTLTNTQWIELPAVKKLAVVKCALSQTDHPRPTRRGVTRFEGSTRMILYGNITDFAIDAAWNISHCSYYTLYDLRMNWDAEKGDIHQYNANDPLAVVNHFIAAGGSFFACKDKLHFFADYGAGQKDMNKDKNWGEAILYEIPGGAEPDNRTGTVTSFTATTLTDSSENFLNADSTKTFLADPHSLYAVFIVDGQGYMQERIIKRVVNNTTLEFDRPWDVDPATDGTTRYVACRVGPWHVYLDDIYFDDVKRSLMIYYPPSFNFHATRLRSRRGGACGDWTPKQNSFAGEIKFSPMVGIYLDDVVMDASLDPMNGITFGVHITQLNQPNAWGTIAANLHYRRMKVKARNPNVDCVIDAYFANEAQNRVRPELSNFANNPARPMVVNTIFENCDFYNLPNLGHIATGTTNVYYKNTGRFNVGNGGAILNEVLAGNSVGAANVVEVGTHAIPNATLLE